MKSIVKKAILIVSIVFSVSFESFAWDTTAAKYFPLQVGNVWVYYGTAYPYANWYSRCRVTGTVDTLGHMYYRIQETIIPVFGNQPCYNFNFFYRLRIDSSSMNIYQAHIFCSQNELLLDSLKARLNDTAWICRPISYSGCTDTSMYNVCNMSVPSKRFTHLPQSGNNTRTYAKGIGLVRWFFSEAGSFCSDTLRGAVINGVLCGDTSIIVGINTIGSQLPDKFALYQNYPNPFNPSTKIRFDIPPLKGDRGMIVRLVIYDALGREIATLVNEQLKPGTYEIEWDAANFPSGVYYYTLTANDFKESKKMLLLK